MSSLLLKSNGGVKELMLSGYKRVTNYILSVLNEKADPRSINNTNICLIPKVKNPTSPTDFRPISLTRKLCI
jgi:hypothetical protein